MTGVFALQTDDKGVFSTTLSQEYEIVAKTFSLTERQLIELASSSIEFIAESAEVKSSLRNYFQFWQQHYTNSATQVMRLLSFLVTLHVKRNLCRSSIVT